MCGLTERVLHKQDGSVKRLAVDHNHETGKIRALLCSECNQMLGKAKDSEETLLAAVAYLRKHKGTAPTAATLTLVPAEALK